MLELPTLQNESVFKDIFHQIEQQHRHVFVTGRAGTGKSTFLTYLKKHTKKKSVVLAPTGVAALNVGGQTIHSFFKFKPRMMDISQMRPLKAKKRIYTQLELLIIDEVSMVRADIFDAIECFLRLNGPKPGELFGGVQLCVIGDLFQLPPVVGYAEREIFERHYRTSYFFSAQCFNEAYFHIYEFEKIFRQQDTDFIHLLNEVRDGNASTHVIDRINARYAEPQLLEKEEPANVITLTSTNALADEINMNKISGLPGEEYVYSGEVEGEFEEKGDKLPVPSSLTLKVGAQVMFIRNDPKRRWVNGTIGTISALSAKSIEVAIHKDGKPRHYRVELEEWENIRYEYDTEALTIKEKVIGSYRQYPLIYAWAITIHKSQGKTIEYIHIDLGRGAFMPGQLYVALSRCPRLDHIRLYRPIHQRDIRTDPEVLRFYHQVKPAKMQEFA